MAETGTRADAYAQALFTIARAEDALEQVENELYQVARTLESDDRLRTTLTDEAIPVERRQGIVEDLLGTRAHPVTNALVSFIVGAGRGRELPDIVDKLVQRAAETRQQALAEVRTTSPLTDEQKQRLAQALSHRTGKKVEVRVIIDPSVLGGVVAQVGDEVYDGSVRHRLNQLREVL
ncbi:MAG: F-type H+-transporting ATPase subunit delta [Acidimicrobiaceae bacterium]|nr:F-type H+-transporting ATPase subunit delta [Acidimicrobiaceae bacterium]